MNTIKNIIKVLIKKIVLIWPIGYKFLAKALLFRNSLHSTLPNVEGQAPVTTPADRKGLFTDYYQNNYWGNKESVSGAGSTLEYTEHIRNEIPKVLEQYKIRKLLDAPCGDYNWLQAMKRPDRMEYIGGDIVEELVRQNHSKYTNEYTRFISIDIVNNLFPQADLWLCRDCLFHFSYDDIFKALSNFMCSDIKYIMTGVHTNCTANSDINTGGARQLNLELPPFNLCKPILYIDDWIPGYTVRRLGFWTKSMIFDSLAFNPELYKKFSNPAKS